MKYLTASDQRKLEIQLETDPNIYKIDLTLLIVGTCFGLAAGFLLALIIFGDLSKWPFN